MKTMSYDYSKNIIDRRLHWLQEGIRLFAVFTILVLCCEAVVAADDKLDHCWAGVGLSCLYFYCFCGYNTDGWVSECYSNAVGL